MELAIEKGIPIPKQASGKKLIYPLADMAIGDSMFSSKVGRSAFYEAAKREGFKVRVLRVTENGIKGWRCWRIK